MGERKGTVLSTDLYTSRAVGRSTKNKKKRVRGIPT